MMDDYEERRQQIAERALAAKFSLWSGMLTAYTVLLSVAVALLVTDVPAGKGAFKLVGYVAILCMALLLLNFALAKSQYEIIGQRLSNPDKELSDAERERNLKSAHLRWCISNGCELASIPGLATEVWIFGWLLLTI